MDVKKLVGDFLNRFEKKESKLGTFLAPVWKEVAPEENQSKFINEGLRSWAYIAISAIADECASNDFFVYKRKGQLWDITESHPLLDLLNKPNSYQTREEFMWLTIGYLLSSGECLWIFDAPKNPKEMVLYDGARVTVNFDKEKIIKSYSIILSDGKRSEVDASEAVLLKLPSFHTPFRGTGVMKYIASTLDTDKFSEDYLRNFYFNSALPNGVLHTEQELNDDIIKRLKTQFEARHKGTKNAHRLAILEKGLKFENTGFNMQQLEMGVTGERIRDKVLAAFKVPKSIVGIVEDVNRANAEASALNFTKRAIIPKLKMIQSQVNQFIIPKFTDGQNLWFEFEAPSMEDELLKAQTRQINILSGVRTSEEYRAEDGLEPLPESNVPSDDDPMENEEMKQARRIDRKKYLAPFEKRIVGAEKAAYVMAEKIVSLKELNERVTKEVNKGPYSEKTIDDWHNKKLENTDKIETDFINRLMQNQARQLKSILDQLTGKSRKKASLTINFDEEEEEAILTALAVPYYERSLLAQAALSAALLNIDNTLDTQDNRLRAFMKKWTGKLGKEHTATEKEFITKALRAFGESEDATIADLRKTLKDHFGDRQMAEMIARTEVSRASGYATETVYKDAGVIGKKWSAAKDERVCEWCDELDGEIVDIGENFIDSGDSFVGRDGGILKADYGPVPAEPSHPNCRCDILPVFENKSVNGSEFKKLQKKLMQADEKAKTIEKKEDELKSREESLAKDLIAFEQLKNSEYEDGLVEKEKDLLIRESKILEDINAIEELNYESKARNPNS